MSVRFLAGAAQPPLSTPNLFQGNMVAKVAIVPAGGVLSAPGAICVFLSNATDLFIEVNGYFAPQGGVGDVGALACSTMPPWPATWRKSTLPAWSRPLTIRE